MKKAAGKIGQCILVYILVMLLADLLFALIYYSELIKEGTTLQHVYIQMSLEEMRDKSENRDDKTLITVRNF